MEDSSSLVNRWNESFLQTNRKDRTSRTIKKVPHTGITYLSSLLRKLPHWATVSEWFSYVMNKKKACGNTHKMFYTIAYLRYAYVLCLRRRWFMNVERQKLEVRENHIFHGEFQSKGYSNAQSSSMHSEEPAIHHSVPYAALDQMNLYYLSLNG